MAAGSQVSAIAFSADAVSGAAGKDGADFELVVVFFDFSCLVIGDFFVFLRDDFAGVRVHHIFQRAAAGNAVCQGFDGLSVFFDLADFYAFHLVHTDFDERNVGGKNGFCSFRSDFGAFRKNQVSFAVIGVFFQFLSGKVDGEVVAHSPVVFGYGVSGAQVEGLLFFSFFAFSGGDDDFDFFYQMVVEKGHIVGVQGLAFHQKDVAVSSVNDVFVKDSSQKVGLQGHNAVLHFRLGSDDALFSVEVQHLYVAVFFADDDVLGNVDQTAGQVAGVCRTECGVGQTFTGAVGGGEVIEDGEAFAEVCLNRQFYGLTGGIGNEAAHAGQLSDLVIITTGAGLGHHGQRVEFHHGALHGSTYFVCLLAPYFNDSSVSFIVGHEPRRKNFLICSTLASPSARILSFSGGTATS